MQSLFLKSALAAGIYLLGSSLAYSGAVFDDLANPVNGSASIDNVLAASFSTGADAGSLSDVKLVLNDINPADGGTVQVSLLSDSSTSPGSLVANIGSISDSSLTSSFATYNFLLASPVALTDNTRYWVEVTDPNSAAKWAYTLINSGVGVPNEFYSDNGVFPNSLGPDLLSVTTVPLPATLALIFAGLPMLRGFGASRRKI